jgi:hypothetical protein
VVIILGWARHRKIAKKDVLVKDFNANNHGAGNLALFSDFIQRPVSCEIAFPGNFLFEGGSGGGSGHLFLDTHPSSILYFGQLEFQGAPGVWIMAIKLYRLNKEARLQ